MVSSYMATRARTYLLCVYLYTVVPLEDAAACDPSSALSGPVSFTDCRTFTI